MVDAEPVNIYLPSIGNVTTEPYQGPYGPGTKLVFPDQLSDGHHITAYRTDTKDGSTIMYIPFNASDEPRILDLLNRLYPYANPNKIISNSQNGRNPAIPTLDTGTPPPSPEGYTQQVIIKFPKALPNQPPVYIS